MAEKQNNSNQTEPGFWSMYIKKVGEILLIYIEDCSLLNLSFSIFFPHWPI